ncbi:MULTISPECIES: glycosyltransferase [unclassified Psychrobacter]|uniref:glycosyltransferase n=1 Tax=unclassified Psychrobacter TaxID=196806 RepID=UPI003F459515
MNQHSKIVLLVINCLQGGGAERSVLTLGQGFHELGYEVHILRFKPLVEYDLNPNLIYHVLRFKPYKLIPNPQLRYQLFAKTVDKYVLSKIGQPDIILSNLIAADRIMFHSKLPNLMYVIRNTMSNKFNLIDSPIAANKIEELKQIYKSSPCVCVSKGVESDLQASLGSDITSTTIYNAFDKVSIEQLADSSLELPHDVLKSNQYLLHVGSFKPEKAHDVLLKAYAKSSMAYPLVLLGKGKMLDQTKELAKKLGISDKVIFLGFNKNPYPFMKDAKGFVLSSRSEGFVRVIQEALALNAPVISTNCQSGPSEMLPESSLVPVDDIDALAIKMTELMAKPQIFKVDFDDKFLPKNIAQQYVDYLSC